MPFLRPMPPIHYPHSRADPIRLVGTFNATKYLSIFSVLGCVPETDARARQHAEQGAGSWPPGPPSAGGRLLLRPRREGRDGRPRYEGGQAVA
jgi:hypothetical protein